MESKDKSNLAVASMVVGILSLIAWILPVCGLPVSIVALVLGIVSWGSAEHNKAVAGVVMSVIGIIATLINAISGAMMFM